METEKILDAEMSRRSLLINGSKCVVGVAGIAALASAVTGCSSDKKADAATDPAAGTWRYTTISASAAADVAYANYFTLFCGSTVLKGIFDTLAQQLGEPFTSYPATAIRWSHGGYAAWGTLCGTLVGAGTAIGLITKDVDTMEAMCNDLAFWYAGAMMPVYEPVTPIKTSVAHKTMANTPVCHISVGKWMKAENVGFMTDGRAERCARVAASIAQKTVEMLNAWHAAGGVYTPVNTPLANVLNNGITSQNNCAECHTTGTPALPPI